MSVVRRTMLKVPASSWRLVVLSNHVFISPVELVTLVELRLGALTAKMELIVIAVDAILRVIVCRDHTR